MSLLDEALQAPGCVLSVIGSHAGEQAAAIFGRKIADCGAVGRTFWVARSPVAQPLQVQHLCAAGGAYVVFVEPSSVRGARPTMEAECAREYSPDRVSWLSLPSRLGPVTGKMDRGATALVLGDLCVDVRGVVDLWEYVNWSDPTLPVKFTLGVSTACVRRADAAPTDGRMKSRWRPVVAVARLLEPYCVWVR